MASTTHENPNTTGRKVRILSIDGGGIRVLSALVIIRELMLGLAQASDPLSYTPAKPCDHFDLIIGTGTGGIAALMLGRLRLSVDQCIPIYQAFTKFIFSRNPSSQGETSGPGTPSLYSAKALRFALRVIVRHSLAAGTQAVPATELGPNALLSDSRPNACRIAVVAAFHGAVGATAQLFRSYPVGMGAGGIAPCTIWEAARATTATSDLFPPIMVDGTLYIDGALGMFNNPSELAKEEAGRIWQGCEIGLLLSVGTGSQKPIDVSLTAHLIRT